MLILASDADSAQTNSDLASQSGLRIKHEITIFYFCVPKLEKSSAQKTWWDIGTEQCVSKGLQGSLVTKKICMGVSLCIPLGSCSPSYVSSFQ
jgi:hypothetical protein